MTRPASALLYNDARESTARPLPLLTNERPIYRRDSSDRPAADYLFCWVSTGSASSDARRLSSRVVWIISGERGSVAGWMARSMC